MKVRAIKCNCGSLMKETYDAVWSNMGCLCFDCNKCSSKISVSKDNKSIIYVEDDTINIS